MIYLSIQSASVAIKEHAEINGSFTPDITTELKLLLERYAQFLNLSLSEAIQVVMGFANEERSPVVCLLLLFKYFLIQKLHDFFSYQELN